MSSTKFPCGCKIEYDLEELAQNIKYCNLHQKLHNNRLDIHQNAAILEDQIYDELIWSEDDFLY